ncbi:hypothetical protein MMC22_002846 [Lobaria immixta]|nr:hypothetical protein [Lobaria immixta]
MSHHLYSDAYEGLPITAPFGSPHLIKLGENMLYRELRIADGIATMLYHYNPEILTKFLDMSIAEVSFTRKNCFDRELWIMRTGRDIIVSCFGKWHGPPLNIPPRFEVEMGFKVDEETGVWKPESIDGPCVSFRVRSGLSAIAPCLLLGAELAHLIIGHEYWKTGPETEFLIRISSAPAT